MTIRAERITELATRKGVRRIAVENFLGTLGDMTYQEAVGNCEADAKSYGWDKATPGAIREGSAESFRGKKDRNDKLRSSQNVGGPL